MTSLKWLAFTGIAILSFSCYLDYTVVNVALPTLQKDLQANLVELQWVMNIYFLALCVFATLMGRLGDLYGRRRLFYIGSTLFAVASLIAGCAVNIETLILGRLLQGIGAAIVLPLGPSLLPTIFSKEAYAKSIGYLGSLGGIALALGPILGGFIVSYMSWRWIFFINIPIIIVGFLFCYSSVPESKSDHPDRNLDWLGAVLLASSLGGIILGILHSQTMGWSNFMTILYLIIGFFSSIALFQVEKRKENPLIDFKDFSHPLFYGGAILCFLAGVLSGVALFFDPLYLQIVRGFSPEQMGMILFAIPIAVFLIALIVGWLVNSLGILITLMLGLGISVIGGFLQIFFTSQISMIYVIFSFLCLGAIWGMGNTVPFIAAQTAVGPDRASVATGTIVTMFNVGGSIGLAIGVAIYHSLSIRALPVTTPAELSQLKELVLSPARSEGLIMNETLHTHLINAFMHGFTGVMWFLMSVSILLLVTLILKSYKKLYITKQ